jgi:hypothetical protein
MYRERMSAPQHGSTSGSVPGIHIATITHAGGLWDTYLEFEDDMQHTGSYRGRLRFDPTDTISGMAARTTVIIIEPSYEEAVAKARTFDSRQLEGLLRSCLPDDS